jgi:hypothetical protein
MPAKPAIILQLAKYPSKNLTTEFFYKVLGEQFKERKWIKRQLKELKNERLVLEPSWDAWRLERSLEAYLKLCQIVDKLYVLGGDGKPSGLAELEFLGSAYSKIMMKTHGEKTIWHISTFKELPPPPLSPEQKKEILRDPKSYLELQLKEQKAAIKKSRQDTRGKILLLLANNLDGIDTSTINKTIMEECGVKERRWIRTILDELRKERLVKRISRQKEHKPSVWKFLTREVELSDCVRRFVSLLEMATRAGKRGEFLKSKYAEEIKKRVYPISLCSEWYGSHWLTQFTS